MVSDASSTKLAASFHAHSVTVDLTPILVLLFIALRAAASQASHSSGSGGPFCHKSHRASSLLRVELKSYSLPWHTNACSRPGSPGCVVASLYAATSLDSDTMLDWKFDNVWSITTLLFMRYHTYTGWVQPAASLSSPGSVSDWSDAYS